MSFLSTSVVELSGMGDVVLNQYSLRDAPPGYDPHNMPASSLLGYTTIKDFSVRQARPWCE